MFDSVTPWTVACQASLSIINSLSLLTHVHWVSDAIQKSHLLPLPSLVLSYSQHQGLFQWVSGKSVGASASSSILPMNIQDWCPLGYPGWISLLSEGPSKVFSSATVRKCQFFSSQLCLWFNSHIHTWLLEKKYSFGQYRPLLTKWCLCFLIRCLGLS